MTEWNGFFLKKMFAKMGFDDKLVSLFMECITSVRYTINHSGKEFGLILPKRGIRQGDPLSSYIFLICMEGLTALINDYERKRFLTGVKIARGAPVLTHMFFADDSYIYSKANEETAVKIDHMLQVYEKASGQQINKAKSSVLFSCNTVQEDKDSLCNILGFAEATEETTYLGLPNFVGRNKKVAFGYLKNRMQKKIEGWDKKYLSKGGKEIMLKTVSQTMPSYAMSIFLLPKQLCTEMESLMCKYWWKTSANKPKGIHWMSWDRLCKKK